MESIQNSRKQRKHKHTKRKERFSKEIYLGTPQAPLSKAKHQPRHELLSDWEHAS